MRILRASIVVLFVVGILSSVFAQEPKPAAPANDNTSPQSYSGMYTFLKEGEFVQLTVEDTGQITGFVSRYGDGESDKGAFLDQFFKSGKLTGTS